MAWGVAFEGSSGSDKLTTPEEFRLLVFNLFGPGMLAGGVVTQRSAGANTSVDVSALTAVVQGLATLGGTTRYLVTNDADDNTGSIGSAPGSNFRNDIIGVYQEDPDAPGSSDTLRMPRYRVISGAGHSVATSPGAAYGATGDPALPDRFRALARVRWSAGMVSIQNAQIDDLRSWSVLARDVVDDANATRLGTDGATASTIMRRDGSGFSKVWGPPTDPLHAANKGYVDSVGTANAVADTIMRRDGSGFSKVWGPPTDPLHAANKGYVDSAVSAAQVPTQGGSYSTLHYAKQGGMVTLNGQQANNTVTGAGYVPPGYLPAATVYSGGRISSGISLNAAGSVEVRSDGSVFTTGGSMGDVIGFSITYPAAT